MVSGLLIKHDAPQWLVGFFSTAVFGLFRSSSCSFDGSLSYDSPVVVFFDREHPRFRNFYYTVPVDVVRLLSFMWIASLTLPVYQWGSRLINLTSFQSGWCPVLWVCSETVRDSHHNWPHRETNDNTLLYYYRIIFVYQTVCSRAMSPVSLKRF